MYGCYTENKLLFSNPIEYQKIIAKPVYCSVNILNSYNIRISDQTQQKLYICIYLNIIYLLSIKLKV